ncbi:MAG: GldG family protein [Armatimonadota bacterium]
MRERETPRWQTVVRAGIFLGLVLLVAGFIVRHIRLRAAVMTDYVALGLWIVGGLLVCVGVALNFGALLRAFRRPRTAEGLNFALVVLLVMAMGGLVCYISTRRFARMDWTGRGTHRLHSQTVNILRALDRDIDVTVLYRSMNPWDMAVYGYVFDMLEEFKSRSPRVHVSTLDLSAEGSQGRLDELLVDLDVQNLMVPAVVLASHESHHAVPFDKIAESSKGPMSPPDTFKGEAAFAGALTKLTEMEKTVLYALTGHGERPLEAGRTAPMGGEAASVLGDRARSLSHVVKALEKDYYEVRPLDLATEGEVPGDCAALLVVGPRAPLTEREIQAIRRYLDEHKGSAIFMVDSRIQPNVGTNVGELLAAYGIRCHDGAVGVSPQLYLTQQGVRGIPETNVPVDSARLPEHASTTELKYYRSVFINPCPLEVMEKEPARGLRAKALLTGVESSWGESDVQSAEDQTAEYSPEEDVSKPVVVGAVVEPFTPPYASPGAPTPEGPRIIVLGSSQSFLNYVLDTVPGNLYLLTNAVNWMAGKVHMLGIPAKTMDFKQVQLTESQLLAARYVFIGVLPGCVVLLGIGVWLLRRR